MSGWIDPSNSGTQQPKYTGISIQTSTQSLPIPLLWGKKRMGTNLIWYGDFVATPDNSKKGGKGGEGKGGAVYNYSAAVILALCEGPITGVGTVWQDKTLTTLANLGLTLFTGTASQAAWSYLTTNHPLQALTYAYTAYLANSSYQLGKSPNLPNHAFEIITPLSGSMSGTPDVNMADVINDFLTNPQYSLGIPSGNIDSTSLATFKAYCQAQGLFMSPDLSTQEQCSSVLDRWAALCNTWVFWSGNVIKFVPLGDTTLANGTSYTVAQQTAVPQAPGPYTFTGFPNVTANGGVTYQQGGAALTLVGGSPAQGQYSYAAGVWTFNQADAGSAIIVNYTYTYAGTTYTPNLTVIYAFGYEDFISAHGDPPIAVTRSDPADAPNHIKLEIKDRNNAYNSAIAEWKDQALCDQFGVIDGPSTQAHEICDLNVGQVVAQLIGQRGAYIRNQYEFKLGWEFGSILEPGDLVSITDAHMGLSGFEVRIKTLDEDENGEWAIVAEEFPGGGTTGTVAGTQIQRATVNTTVNVNVNPGNVNPPCVFEPASSLTNGIAQLWVSASGGANWGGAVVYISLDNVNYFNIGTITSPAPQGVLTANLADYSSANPDVTNTLSIDLTESQMPINNNATHADAAAGRTLCIVTPSFTNVCPTNGEAMAYGAAALTGTYTANLTYLYRSLDGTTHSSHASGSFFTRIDLGKTGGVGNTTLIYNLPASYVGQTIYLKLCSFNRFGNQLQSLASATAYSYTPTGTGYGGGTGGVPTTPTGLIATPGAGANVLTWNANPSTDNVKSYAIFAASGLSQPFGSATQVGTSASPFFIHANLSAGSQWTYFAEAVNAVGASSPTAGVNCTTGSGAAIRYDIDSWLYGTQSVATQIVRRFTAPRAITIPTSGHEATADVAATGSTVFTIYKNGVSAGTVTFAASGITGTFSISSTINLVAGDVLEIKGPATADATLAQVNIILAGTA
jgi:hypothetical protein